MATVDSLKREVVQNQGAAPAAKPETVLANYLERMKPEIEKALPAHMTADRMARIALTTVRTNPKLLECNISSVMAGIMQASQLGLEFGLLGHCYLIPYGKEATFMLSYKGMIELARRSGNIKSIYAHSVYKNDMFKRVLGIENTIEHEPAEGDRGEFIGVYAVAHFKDGGYQFEYLSKAEVEKKRNHSKMKNSKPWTEHYEEMAKKTALRSLFKYLPVSVEVQEGISQDVTVRKDITDEPEYIDIEVTQ